jgi:hypothetical protein
MKKIIFIFVCFASIIEICGQNFTINTVKKVENSANNYTIATTKDKNNNSYNLIATPEASIDLDPGPNVFSFTGLAMVKYDANMNFIWGKIILTNIYANYDTQFNQISLDNTGNIILTGQISGPQDFDFGSGQLILTGNNAAPFKKFIAKYTPIGDVIWAKLLGTEVLGTLFFGSNDNMYMYGSYTGTKDLNFDSTAVYNLSSIGLMDCYLLKMDASANFVWAKSYGGLGNDVPQKMEFDKFGDILNIGTFEGSCDFDPSSNTSELTSSGETDLYFSKYNSNGELIWVKSISGPNAENFNTSIFDKDGNIIIAGTFKGIPDFDPGLSVSNASPFGTSDIFLVKYNLIGSLIWVKSFGGNAEGTKDLSFGGPAPVGYEYISNLAIDNIDNIYATGKYFTQDKVVNWYGCNIFEDVQNDFDPGPGIFSLPSRRFSNPSCYPFNIPILKSSLKGNIFLVKFDEYGVFKEANSFTSRNLGASIGENINSGFDINHLYLNSQNQIILNAVIGKNWSLGSGDTPDFINISDAGCCFSRTVANIALNQSPTNQILQCTTQSELYVDANVSTSGNGLSWQFATKTLQEALNIAWKCSNIKRINVAKGTYIPTEMPRNFDGSKMFFTNKRDVLFHIPKGVSIYGGYPNGGGLRNSKSNETILSADIDATVDNAYRLITNVGNNQDFTMDGFTIKDIQIKNDVSILFVKIANTNDPLVDYARLDATYNGFELTGNKVTISNCKFTNNEGTSNIKGQAVTYTSNISTGNTKGYSQGAIVLNATNGPLNFNKNFHYNNIGTLSAGFSFYGTPINIINNVFNNNTLTEYTTNANFLTVAGNDNNIYNNTIFQNERSGSTGQLLSVNKANPAVTVLTSNVVNNIIANFGANANVISGTAAINVRKNLFAITIPGNYNFSPSFVNAFDLDGLDNLIGTADDGLSLLATSPAINIGEGNYPGIDIINRVRIGLNDIGAYESEGAILAPVTSTITNTIGTNPSFFLTPTNYLIASLNPVGSNPVSGVVNANVWIDPAQSATVKRHYEITPSTNATTATGKVTLYFTQADFTDYNSQIPAPSVLLPANPTDTLGIANLKIEKRSGISSDGTGSIGSYSGSPSIINPVDEDIKWDATNSRWEVTFEVIGFSGFWAKTVPIVPVCIFPTATLTGTQAIEAGQTANLSVALTSTGPWTLILNGTSYTVNSSLVNIPVSPSATTTYSLSSVSIGCGAGTTNGSALITIIPVNPCQSSLNFPIGVQASGVYKANTTIISKANSSIFVYYAAGNSISLMPGFEVKPNGTGVFKAEIKVCN